MIGKRNKSKKGFTIIELLLAMSFLATLLVCIAILILNITSIYQKGLSIRAVSSVGKGLIDEFTRTVSAAPIKDINPKDTNGDKILSNAETEASVKQYFYQISSGGTQVGGAFCTGLYTYIWNTAATFADSGNPGKVLEAPITLRYTDDNGVVQERSDFKLYRIVDSERAVCSDYADPNTGGSRTVDMRTRGTISPIELINSDEANLALYDFTVFPATQNTITGQTFYSATFILATIKGGIDITANGDYCQGSPTGLVTDFNYCAVNKFNFAMRATGYTAPEDGCQYGCKGD